MIWARRSEATHTVHVIVPRLGEPEADEFLPGRQEFLLVDIAAKCLGATSQYTPFLEPQTEEAHTFQEFHPKAGSLPCNPRLQYIVTILKEGNIRLFHPCSPTRQPRTPTKRRGGSARNAYFHLFSFLSFWGLGSGQDELYISPLRFPKYGS